jgi:TonB family protein
MNRPILPMGLLLLLAPALPAAAGSTTSLDLSARIAEPREVILAFADLCLMAPNAAAEDSAVKARGGTPITAKPQPGSPPGRHFDLRINEVPARVGFSDSVCMLDVNAADVSATSAVLDDFLANVFKEMGAAEAHDDRPLPPGARMVRDMHLAKPGDPFGLRLTLLAMDRPGAPSSMVLFRSFEEPDAQAQAAPAGMPLAPVAPQPTITAGADNAPSEAPGGRANFPPVYPEAASKVCASGVVRVRVSINAQGKVLNVAIDKSSGNRDLDRAAADAARQWSFNPGKAEGEPVGGDIIVPVDFQDPCPKPAEPTE